MIVGFHRIVTTFIVLAVIAGIATSQLLGSLPTQPAPSIANSGTTATSNAVHASTLNSVPPAASTFTPMTASVGLERLTDKVVTVAGVTQTAFDYCDLAYISLPTTSVTTAYKKVLFGQNLVSIETMEKVQSNTMFRVPVVPLLVSGTNSTQMVFLYQMLCGNLATAQNNPSQNTNTIFYSPVQEYKISTATDIPPVVRLNANQFVVDAKNQFNGLIATTPVTSSNASPTPPSLNLDTSTPRPSVLPSFTSLNPSTQPSTSATSQPASTYDIHLFPLSPSSSTQITSAVLTVILNDADLMQYTMTPTDNSNNFVARFLHFSPRDSVYFRFTYTIASSATQITSSWFSWSAERLQNSHVILPINQINETTGSTSSAPSTSCSTCVSSCPTAAPNTAESIKACWEKCCSKDDQENLLDWLNSIILLNPSTSSSLFPSSTSPTSSIATLGGPGPASPAVSLPARGTPGPVDLTRVFPFTTSSYHTANILSTHGQVMNTYAIINGVSPSSIAPEGMAGITSFNPVDTNTNVNAIPVTQPVDSLTTSFPSIPNLNIPNGLNLNLPLQVPTSAQQLAQLQAQNPQLNGIQPGIPPSGAPIPFSAAPPTLNPSLTPPSPSGATPPSPPALPISFPMDPQKMLNDLATAKPALNVNGLFPNLISSPSTVPSNLIIPLVGPNTVPATAPTIPTGPNPNANAANTVLNIPQSTTTTATPLQLRNSNANTNQRNFKTAQFDLSSLGNMFSGLGGLGSASGIAGGVQNGLLGQLTNPQALNNVAANLPTKVKETTCLEAACLSQCMSSGQPLWDTMETGMSQMQRDGMQPPVATPNQLPSPMAPTGAVSMPAFGSGPGSGLTPPMPSAATLPDAVMPSSPKAPTSGIFSASPEMVQQMPMEQLKPLAQQQMGLAMGNITNIQTGSSDMLNCVNQCQASCKAGQTAQYDCTGENKSSLECMGQSLDNLGGTSDQLGGTINTITNGAQSSLDTVTGVLPFPGGPGMKPFQFNGSNRNNQHIASDESFAINRLDSVNTFNLKQIFRTMQFSPAPSQPTPISQPSPLQPVLIQPSTASLRTSPSPSMATNPTTLTTAPNPSTLSTTPTTRTPITQFTSLDDIFSPISTTTSSATQDIDINARAAYLQQLLSASTTALQIATPLDTINRNNALNVVNQTPATPSSATSTVTDGPANMNFIFNSLPESIQPSPSLALADKLVGLTNLSTPPRV